METENLQIIDNEAIEERIFVIRGTQVMFDSDVAYFFGTEVKKLNQQMKRNKERFPDDFCFQLNSNEFKTLRSQNVTIDTKQGKRKYLPYVYTEHGILSLAGVIKNETAAKMSVEIVKKFVQMRKFIIENGDVLLKLAQLQNRQINFEVETNKRFDEIINKINKADLPKQVLFFDGQYFDAYDFIVSLISKAKRSLLLMDPYCDDRAVSLLKNINDGGKATIYKSNKAKLSDEMIEAFRKQYGEITVKNTETFHDRFLIIDNEECYFLGTSINYAGKKAFAVNKAEKEIVDLLLTKLL